MIFTSTTFGSIATYNCFPGYNLIGVEQRTCEANGEWSGEEPTCQSKRHTTKDDYMEQNQILHVSNIIIICIITMY